MPVLGDEIDQSPLNWLQTQHQPMCELVERLANINSGSHHLEGLQQVGQELAREFDVLGGQMTWLDLPEEQTIDSQGQIQSHPLGKALRITKRLEAKRRVFLCIHMDTVYGPQHPFQRCRYLDPHTLNGPGVADAKGGLVVMLYALRALEQFSAAASLGWEVYLNPDEEIGSPGSAAFLAERAGHHDFGLLFEPSLPDGTLVSRRKGSGNFTLVMSGRSAHAGREFERGRNAIAALARLITDIDQLNGAHPGLTINFGRIEGGSALNMVPDLAICRMNVRAVDAAQQQWFQQQLAERVQQADAVPGYGCQLHGNFYSPPKMIDPAIVQLQGHLERCGSELGLEIRWRETGGTSDGNKLYAAGLPNIDTLGPRGGNIHSSEEYLIVDSLVERAQLVALLLMRYAAGQLSW